MDPEIQIKINFEGLGVGFFHTHKVLLYEAACYLHLHRARGFCELLPCRFNRFPLPYLSLLGDIA